MYFIFFIQYLIYQSKIMPRFLIRHFYLVQPYKLCMYILYNMYNIYILFILFRITMEKVKNIVIIYDVNSLFNYIYTYFLRFWQTKKILYDEWNNLIDIMTFYWKMCQNSYLLNPLGSWLKLVSKFIIL